MMITVQQSMMFAVEQPTRERKKRRTRTIPSGYIVAAGKPPLSLGPSIMSTESSSSLFVSDDQRESIIATAEIMADDNLMGDLRISIEQMNQGELLDWEDVKAQLGL